MNKNKFNTHLNWIMGLILITLIICGTLIWINYNSWTVRFEMDDNTKEAVESIEWDNINDHSNNLQVRSCEELKNNFSLSQELQYMTCWIEVTPLTEKGKVKG